MKTAKFNREARQRQVNLTLNEDLAVQVSGLTDNLSGVVESLLVDYVEYEHRQRIAKARTLEATISLWNTFNAKRESFADEYSLFFSISTERTSVLGRSTG